MMSRNFSEHRYGERMYHIENANNLHKKNSVKIIHHLSYNGSEIVAKY